MMKKLLVLMLVLGMASWANASMVMDISINGNLTPLPDSGITLQVSDTLTLDIHSLSGFAPGDGEYFALLTMPACATITGGAYVGPAELDASAVLGPYTKDSESGQLYTVDAYGGQVSAPAGKYFDEMIFHCESLNGPTVVNLYGTVTGDTWRLADSVIIHQPIPEPMTIVLLGLGGLFLRCRKK